MNLQDRYKKGIKELENGTRLASMMKY